MYCEVLRTRPQNELSLLVTHKQIVLSERSRGYTHLQLEMAAVLRFAITSESGTKGAIMRSFARHKPPFAQLGFESNRTQQGGLHKTSASISQCNVPSILSETHSSHLCANYAAEVHYKECAKPCDVCKLRVLTQSSRPSRSSLRILQIVHLSPTKRSCTHSGSFLQCR